MKKILFTALGVGLLLTSCQSDEPFAPGEGQEIETTFTINVPEAMGTRAGEGYESSAKGGLTNVGEDLYYTVALVNQSGNVVWESQASGREAVTFTTTVVSGYQYRVIAYARFDKYVPKYGTPNYKVGTFDGNQVDTEDHSLDCINTLNGINDEKGDGYYCDVTAVGGPEMSATLRRPFGKLRLVAEDYDEIAKLGLEVKKITVTYPHDKVEFLKEFRAVGHEFLSDKVDIASNQVFTYEGETDYADEADKGDNGVYTVFVDYLPAPSNGSEVYYPFNIEVEYEGTGAAESFTRKFTQDIPVKRNHLTTLRGNFFTEEAALTLTIDEMFEDELVYEYWNGDQEKVTPTGNIYTIENANQLAWFAQEVNGGNTFEGKTVKLAANIDLGKKEWTPIGRDNTFKGTFDGQNNTIANLKVTATDKSSVGLFGSARIVKNVKIKNVDLSGHYKAGAVVGDGLASRIENCHVDGGSIVITPINKDDANNVGGIVGYLSAEPNAWVKESSVKNLTVSAYRSVGGIAGRALGSAVVVENNVVENVTVIADMSHEYDATNKAIAVGEVVGDNMANIDLSSNTVTNVEAKVIVNTDAALAKAVDDNTVKNIDVKGTVKAPYLKVSRDLTIKSVNPNSPSTIDGSFKVTGHLTMKNLKFKYTAGENAGESTSQYRKSMIALMDEGDFTAEKVTFTLEKADNTAITAWWSTGTGANITVKECVFNCNGQRPIRSDACVTVEDCVFNDQYRYAVQMTSKSSTMAANAPAYVNFYRNTINAGNTSDKKVVYGIQLEGADYGCGNLTINGSDNVINLGNTDKKGAMYYCECGKVDHNTIVCNTEVAPLHDGQDPIANGLAYDDNAKTYFVGNANGLVVLSNLKIEGGQKVVLAKDIDLSGVEFNGLNAPNYGSSNSFDGQGHTVSNWTYTGKKTDMGFIREWIGPIKNVTISNASLKTNGRSAVVAAKVYGDIENCHVVNSSIEDTWWACGAIAGLYNTGSISNCSVTNSTIKSGGGTGGIVGVINETAGARNIINCDVKDCIIDNSGAADPYTGAAVAGMINVGNSTITFDGCDVSGCNISNIYGHVPNSTTVTVK